MDKQSRSALFPLTRVERTVAFVLGVIAATCLFQAEPAARASTPDLQVVDARTCAALAVYDMAPLHATDLLSATAAAALNSAREAASPPNCGRALASAMGAGFDPVRWQRALDIVDNVQTGDYVLAPDACARANQVVPPTSVLSPDAQARAQCVIQGYAFVEVSR